MLTLQNSFDIEGISSCCSIVWHKGNYILLLYCLHADNLSWINDQIINYIMNDFALRKVYMQLLGAFIVVAIKKIHQLAKMSLLEVEIWSCVSLDGNSHSSFSKQSWKIKMYSSTLLFHEKLLPKMSISEKLFSCLTNSLVNITKDMMGVRRKVVFIFQGLRCSQSKHGHRARREGEIPPDIRCKQSPDCIYEMPGMLEQSVFCPALAQTPSKPSYKNSCFISLK